MPDRRCDVGSEPAEHGAQRSGEAAGSGSASAADPDARELWELIQSDFHKNQATVVKVLARRKALRPGLAAAQAVEILWTINHPDVWQLLTVGRTWTPSKYEEWTAETACSQLLPPSA